MLTRPPEERVMRRTTKVSLALAVFALAGCATGLPARSGPERGGIGISINVRPSIGLPIFTRESQRVYFVRVDGEKGLFTQDHVILSNYFADGWVYLLDALPGRYAAVASVSSKQGRDDVIVFPEQLIEATVVTVSPGAMAFMGEYLVKASYGVDNADVAQRHYLKIIRPSAIIGITATLPTNVMFYKGSALQAQRDRATEMRFFSTAAGHLQGTEWNGLLERATKDLKGR
jgi:hypothetical protein